MGTVNKQSVRTEFDQIKVKFKTLVEEGKVPTEMHELFSAMLLLFELILSIFLEKQTPKTPKNSSKPSSQTEKDETAKKQKGTKGKGHKAANEQVSNRRTIETTQIIRAVKCERCGASLENEPCQCYEERTRIDIIFEKKVEHYKAEVKKCPNCNAKAKGKYPSDLHGPLQYGPGIKAYATELLIAQMVSVNRVAKMLNALIGADLSEATLLSYVLRLSERLEEWEKRTRKALLKAPTLHVDETSMRVNGKQYWVHVYSWGELTIKHLHRKRGKKAMKAIDIIPRYKGVLTHDCWSSYLSYDNCIHSLCGSHLLRELAFVIESNGYRWAKNLKRLLKEACAAVTESKEKCLDQAAYARLQRRYRNILTRGEKVMPPLDQKPSGQRGRIAKSDAHNLLERLQRYEAAVLMFAQNSDVAFTNNRAERDLRMSKVKQKVSGCFRTAKYARAYCRISSYLQSQAYQGVNPMIALQRAFSGDL